MRILFFGDVFGKAGRCAFLEHIESLKAEFQPDFVVINGENLADGKGLTEKTSRPLFQAGVDVITGGNHLWDRAESLDYIRTQPRIVKPQNHPPATPGSISHTVEKGDKSLTVICLTGQVFMPPCDSPFLVFDRWIESQTKPNQAILMDFHAESTAEKRAMGWHVDGRISAIVGTHTHIQTADEEILLKGTAYISDVGMTGPHESVIGMKKSIIVEKFRNGIPIRYEVSDRGNQVNAVCIDIDDSNGRAAAITRIKRNIKQLLQLNDYDPEDRTNGTNHT